MHQDQVFVCIDTGDRVLVVRDVKRDGGDGSSGNDKSAHSPASGESVSEGSRANL